ncbi:nitrogen regulatory IIA protein [Flavobacterium sp. LHD-85]|uniref:nitrogen regulatory IIA protein n=1 Tax=Flavobacterium sp. LHD-85 TaxID=3071410 RepID=UPI0027E1E486|nr:nitrogen regulatory IIA protein [Flavobacterium sp. LHD-85]MDQ6532161.1 nitrogen regulatory IIA protein [Flavobacterium sp. LHD-85]
MRKLQADLDKWFESLAKRWQALELRRQQQCTLYFFIAYVLLTAGILIKICLDTAKSNAGMEINHIENPVLKKK